MKANDSLAEWSQPPDSGTGPSTGEVGQWIADAKAGSAESWGQLSERCRRYLLLVANKKLEAGLQSKVGASDLVQETLLKARQCIGRFEGDSESQLLLWLRRILIHQLAHTSRSYRQCAKRDISREQELDDGDSRNVWGELIDQAPTPRGNAIANERVKALERTVDQLPEHYREVIRLRSFELRPFGEIGQLLQTSPDAARKLWCRAVEMLRRNWDAIDESR